MIMSRFKGWLYNRFLPAWCKDDLMDANARLADVVAAQARELERLRAYIGGMEAAIRRGSRVTVHTGVKP